ncbi:unnamed protein product, partial [Porites lobata]
YTERLGHYFEANGIGEETASDKAKRRACDLIFHLTTMDRDLNEMLETHSSTVQENLDEKEGVKVKIFVEPTERPRHFKARPVAYALREKNENEYGSTCP